MAGRGVALVFFGLMLTICAPFMILGWAAYRLGLVD